MWGDMDRVGGRGRGLDKEGVYAGEEEAETQHDSLD